MSRVNRFRSTLFLSLSLMLLWHMAAMGQKRATLRAVLDQTVTIDLNDESPLAALLHLSSRYSIPMGIVWTKLAEQPQTVTATFKDRKLGDVLQALKSSMPAGTSIVVGDEIVQVRQVGANADIQWLHIPLGAFSVKDDFADFASYRLRSRIQHRLFEMGLREPTEKGVGCAGSVTGGLGDAKISLSLADATPELVLDELVIKSGFSAWLVVYPAPQKVKSKQSGSAPPKKSGQTVALNSSMAIESSWQPYWMLISPGLDPTSTQYRYRTDWVPLRVAEPKSESQGGLVVGHR